MIANSGPQLLVVDRRHHRLVVAIGGVVALFRQSPDRAAARHRRRRDGDRAGAGTDARAARRGSRADVAHAESRGLELAVGLALPATLGLIVLAEPIVRLLFAAWRVHRDRRRGDRRALTWLALGLPAHVLVKALSPAFFAREDTLAPLLATLKARSVAIVAGRAARPFFRPAGSRRRASRCGAWSNAASLIRSGQATFGFSIDAAARRRLPRMVAAALRWAGCCGWTRLLPTRRSRPIPWRRPPAWCC